MKLMNDCYAIRIHGKTWTERYYRDAKGWVKVSARRRKFRATAEQVLNHLLPALAGIKDNLAVSVEYRDQYTPKPQGGGRRLETSRPTPQQGRRRNQLLLESSRAIAQRFLFSDGERGELA